MKPGIYDITNEEYHASEGISNSGIRLFKRSPLHFWDCYLNLEKPVYKQTAEQIFGSAVHTFLLEPQLFNKQYVVAPVIENKQRNPGKKEWEEFKKNNQDRNILLPEDMKVIEAIALAVEKHPIARNIIKSGDIEKSFYWIDEETGLLCKSRPDILGQVYIGDLKTTVSAAERAFMHSIYKYGYHRQAAMALDAVYYTTGNKIDSFINIPVEKERPYAVATYLLDEMAIEQGRLEYRETLKKMKECFETNHWPGYGESIQPINLPSYAFNGEPV
jgi:hypothetical protein